VLASAIADIIWRCTDGFSVSTCPNVVTVPKAVVVLPQDTSYLQHSVHYFQDGLTETVRSVFCQLFFGSSNRLKSLGNYIHIVIHILYTYSYRNYIHIYIYIYICIYICMYSRFALAIKSKMYIDLESVTHSMLVIVINILLIRNYGFPLVSS